MRLEDSVVEAASLPFAANRFLFHYARGKMRFDPVYPVLASLLRARESERECLLDLGCGAGVFASYLRASGICSPIRGVDLDAGKIGFAQQHVAAAWPKLYFETGDLFDFELSSGDIVALDVLHYFNDSRQNALLRRLARTLAPGCILYIRNGIRDAGWRHWITSLEEGFVRTTRWIRGGDWNFPSGADIDRILRSEGLAVVAVPMWGKTPFSSYLFVAARPSRKLKALVQTSTLS